MHVGLSFSVSNYIFTCIKPKIWTGVVTSLQAFREAGNYLGGVALQKGRLVWCLYPGLRYIWKLGYLIFICECFDVCRSGNLRWYWRTHQNLSCHWNTSNITQPEGENGNLQLENYTLSLNRHLIWCPLRRPGLLMHSAECE